MPTKPVAIRCACGTLFGYADASGFRIIIKHRDLYRIITGDVKGPCRKCGQEVEWLQTKSTSGDDAA